MLTLGAALGGLVAGWFGTDTAFILDSLCPFVTVVRGIELVGRDFCRADESFCRSTLDVASHDREVALDALQPRDPREQSPALEPEPLK